MALSLRVRRFAQGLLACTLFLSLSANSASPAQAASSDYVPGPWYGEQKVYFCGPAAVQMAIARSPSAPSVPSQGTLAWETDTYHNPRDLGTPSAEHAARVLNNRVISGDFRYYYWSAQEIYHLNGIFLKNVMYSIDRGFPVVVNIKVDPWDTRPPNYPVRSDPIYHYVTVVGYSNYGQTLTIADPAGAGGADGVLPDDWNNVAREWSYPTVDLFDLIYTGYAAGYAPDSNPPKQPDPPPTGGVPGGGDDPGAYKSRTVGDFDNDGTTELALYRQDCAAGSSWWVTSVATGTQLYGGHRYGGCNDIPVPGDYDSDGYADQALYRRDCTNGSTWWVNSGRAGEQLHGGLKYGGCNDIPVSGDFDNDGYSDLALYRRDCTNGSTWWVASGRTRSQIIGSLKYGGCNDIPVTSN